MLPNFFIIIKLIIKGLALKTREFIITKEGFDLDYNSQLTDLIVEDYLYEDLEIPHEYIKSFQIADDYVNIKLQNSRQYFNDDWYVNLHRVG